MAPTPRKSINGGDMVVSKWGFAMFSAADVDDDGSLTETCDADATESEKQQQRFTIKRQPIHKDLKQPIKKIPNNARNSKNIQNKKERLQNGSSVLFLTFRKTLKQGKY